MNPKIAAAKPLAPLHLAIVGAGPVGLALALQAAESLPEARITVFDARPLDRDVSADPRTLAMSLGSVQLLQRLGAWDPVAAQPILEVHVSQSPPSLGGLLATLVGEPEVRIRAIDEAVPMLGAVLSYGAIVAPLQRAWLAAVDRSSGRLASRFGTPVVGLKNVGAMQGNATRPDSNQTASMPADVYDTDLPGASTDPTAPAGADESSAASHRNGPHDAGSMPFGAGVEVDAGFVDRFDLCVVAEGGVFAGVARESLNTAGGSIRHDYGQTAWVGTVSLEGARPGVAYERFTRYGPAALLPLKDGRAAIVWCVDSLADPVAELDDAQRLVVLGTLFHAEVGRVTSVSPLKRFALGLDARHTLTDGRIVRIGNAAQTLHPVAGQGLNLGLRDAFELVAALSTTPDIDRVLRRLEWKRGPDRWAMIAATDFLARSFTWKLPGAGAARGLGMAALQALGPVKSLLAQRMMFGSR